MIGDKAVTSSHVEEHGLEDARRKKAFWIFRSIGAGLTIAGAAIIIVGSTLPWASDSLVTTYGTDRSGKATIMGGVLLILATILFFIKELQWVGPLLAGITAAIILFHASSEMTEISMYKCTVESGLYVIQAGAFIVLLGGVVGAIGPNLTRKRKQL